MGVWIEIAAHAKASAMGSSATLIIEQSPLTQGRGLKKCRSVKVVYIPFYVREIFTFFLRVLSMYLTCTDLHFPSFSGFFALFC